MNALPAGPLGYSLLAVAGLVVVLSAAAAVSSRLGQIAIRLAVAGFDRFESSPEHRVRRRGSLRSAHVPVTYREYAAVTGLKATVAGVVGAILGVYAVHALVVGLTTPQAVAADALPAQLSRLATLAGAPEPTAVELLAIYLGGGLAVGGGLALGTYYYRWYRPKYVAEERGRQIEMSLPMTVSFIYALSRSGMPLPRMLRILAENDHVYGHAAEEARVAVRNIEVFNTDVVTAVKTMARRTPSEKYREFSDNLASVLQTGGSMSEFLEREYQEFRREAEAQQERLLELIETLAEAYVALGVVGPLFLIVILTIVGITAGNALPILRLVVYVVMPLGNLAIIVYLSTVVDNLSRQDPTEEETEVNLTPVGIRRYRDLALEAGTSRVPETDGGRPTGAAGSDAGDDGWTTDRAPVPDPSAVLDRDVQTEARETMERLAVYRQWREVKVRLRRPVRTVVRRPAALLWVTFPLAVFLVGIRLPAQLADGTLTPAEFDDLLIQSLVFLFGSFAVVYEIHRRRVEAIEAAIPDFLTRLASLNEAGMTVADSLDRVRDTELGTLDEELDVVWRDLQWGADIETALKRFEARVRTKTISRVVTLLTEAMNASGEIGRVLRIAAEQAKDDRRLKRKRRQQMLTYLIVVYVAFVVFLFIVGVLNNVLIPNLPEGGAVAASGSDGAAQAPGRAPPVVGNLSGLDEAAYQLTFLHATVVQAVFSGLVAGQLSTGDLRAGAKHVTILTLLGYGVLALVL